MSFRTKLNNIFLVIFIITGLFVLKSHNVNAQPVPYCSAPTNLNQSYTCSGGLADINFSWQDNQQGPISWHVQLDTDTSFITPIWEDTLYTTSATALNIDPGSYYYFYWRVRVETAQTTYCWIPGNWTAPRMFNISCAQPQQCSVPTNLTQGFSCNSGGTTANAHFDWDPITGTGITYRFQYDTDNLFSNPIQTNYTANSFVDIPSITAGNNYYWRVQAYISSSCTPNTNVWATQLIPLNVTCNPPGNQCSAPSGMNQSYTCPDSDANVTFSWQPVTGAGTYSVQLSENTSFNPLVWSVQNTGNTTETATNIIPRNYFWRVFVDTSSFCTVPGSYITRQFTVACGSPAPPPPPGNGGIIIPPIDFDLLQGIASPNFPGGTTIGNIIAASFIYLFAGAGLILTIFILYGGFTLMLSRGDPGAVAKGKGILSAALIGLVIVITAFWIVQLIGEFLDIQAIKNIF